LACELPAEKSLSKSAIAEGRDKISLYNSSARGEAREVGVALFAMSIGCLANWFRNRSFHCAITGPLFLIGGVMFLLSGVRMIHLDTRWVWPILLVGIGIAFLLEWLYGKRPAPYTLKNRHVRCCC
jgi:hypothetical protein